MNSVVVTKKIWRRYTSCGIISRTADTIIRFRIMDRLQSRHRTGSDDYAYSRLLTQILSMISLSVSSPYSMARRTLT